MMILMFQNPYLETKTQLFTKNNLPFPYGNNDSKEPVFANVDYSKLTMQ